MRTNRKVIRLTESRLRSMIAEAIQEALEEDDLEEGKWLNRVGGLALGAASLFGGYGNANARNNNYNNNQIEQTTNKISEQQMYQYINSWVNNGFGNGIYTHEQLQEKLFDNFDESEIGKNRILDMFLYKNKGKYITPDNCTPKDIEFIINNTEERIRGNIGVSCFYIGDTQYFINMGAFHDIRGL